MRAITRTCPFRVPRVANTYAPALEPRVSLPRLGPSWHARGMQLLQTLRLRLRKACALVLLLVLSACAGSSAYQRTSAVADKVLPVLQVALQLTQRQVPLPGAAESVKSLQALLDAWKAQDAGKFNAALPCVVESLRLAASAAALNGRTDVSMHLDAISDTLRALAPEARCVPTPRESETAADPDAVPSASSDAP